MAKKSKTQKAKASAARAQKKQEQEVSAVAEKQPAEAEKAEAKESRIPFKKPKSSEMAADKDSAKKAEVKKSDKKDAAPKKRRFQFLYDVRAELKRVTWPSRQDVLRWSLVVLGALLFFGILVFLLDNYAVTPILVFISGLGA